MFPYGRHEITAGCSDEDFFKSLREGTGGTRKSAWFVIEADSRISIVINDAERVDGSGCRWRFRGYDASNGRSVAGFYDTHRREGYVEILR